MWRPYVISKVHGTKNAMRDTRTYATKEQAISAMKSKNKKWMELNYTAKYAKASNFEYGAIKVGKSGYKYLKGQAGNKQLVKDHYGEDSVNIVKKSRQFMHQNVPKGYHKMPDGTIMKDSDHKSY